LSKRRKFWVEDRSCTDKRRAVVDQIQAREDEGIKEDINNRSNGTYLVGG
jgi:hypothetical protein